MGTLASPVGTPSSARRPSAAGEGSPRVLIIPPSYDAANRILGGGERYAVDYARALAELTPTTLVLFGEPRPPVDDGRLRILTVDTGPVERRLVSLSSEFRSLLRDADVVHSMIFPKPVTDRVLAWCRLRRKPLVLTDVGGGGPSVSGRLRRIHPRLDPNRLASGLALLSNHSATEFESWSMPKIVLHGGVRSDAEVTPVPERGHALFVGRLLPHKGVLELIQAVKPDLPLRIVGRPYDDGYLARLREAARGADVSFHVDVPDEELKRHLAEAAVVVQPSLPVGAGFDYSELLGLAALEGMAAGRAAIVSTAGSLPELVVEGETGFVVPAGDVATLRDRIRQLLVDHGLAARMGEAARRHVVEKYSWESAAVRGLELYRAVLEPRRRARR